MSKKKNNDLTMKLWRSFNIEMPEALIPLYDFLQSELNRVLSDETLMGKIKGIDIEQHKGTYWRALAKAIGKTFSQWGIGANAWYQRMLYENIRRVMESGKERRCVHDTLVKYGNETTDEFWKELHELKCYPKHGVVRNVRREIDNGSFTAVPTSTTFVMDYSNVSDNAINRNISKRRWMFRTSKTSWIDIEVFLPKNIRAQATGEISKPRFVKRSSDGCYVGCVSYEISVDAHEDTNKVFGVDLGIVKPFSGSALDANGHVSSEYVISKRTQHLVEKYERICESLDNLLEKQKRCEGLVEDDKFKRRDEEIGYLRCKKRNLRTEIVRFIAFDIVLAALAEDCGEVHIENLSWLDARGGYWNHSEVQAALSDLAAVYGLHVCKVSAAYSSTQSPFTGEIGVERDRDVVFGDGWVVDRDFLSSVNLACRPVEKDGKQREIDVSLKDHKSGDVKRVRRKHRACLGLLNKDAGQRVEIDYSEFLSGGIDVVVFSAGVGGLPPARSVTVTANTGNMTLNNDNQIKEKVT